MKWFIKILLSSCLAFIVGRNLIAMHSEQHPNLKEQVAAFFSECQRCNKQVYLFENIFDQYTRQNIKLMYPQLWANTCKICNIKLQQNEYVSIISDKNSNIQRAFHATCLDSIIYQDEKLFGICSNCEIVISADKPRQARPDQHQANHHPFAGQSPANAYQHLPDNNLLPAHLNNENNDKARGNGDLPGFNAWTFMIKETLMATLLGFITQTVCTSEAFKETNKARTGAAGLLGISYLFGNAILNKLNKNREQNLGKIASSWLVGFTAGTWLMPKLYSKYKANSERKNVKHTYN